MDINPSSSPASVEIDKWQTMADVVSQNNTLVQPDFNKQYQKLTITRLFTENALTFLLQFIGLMFAGAPTPYSISPVWFASGTACAFIFLRSNTVLPGIFFGSMTAYYLLTANLSTSLLSAGIAAFQAYLLLWITHRRISPTLVFYNRSQFINFILSCGLLTGFTSFLSLATYYLPFHDSALMLQLGLRWWLGNFGGILIFALAILTWDFYYMQLSQVKTLNKIMLTFFYGVLFIDIIVLLFNQTPIVTLIATLLTVPIIFTISLRLGWCGVIAAIFLFGLSLNLGAYLETPLFTSLNALSTSTYIQTILVIETIVGLFFSFDNHINNHPNTQD